MNNPEIALLFQKLCVGEHYGENGNKPNNHIIQQLCFIAGVQRYHKEMGKMKFQDFLRTVADDLDEIEEKEK